MKSCAVSYSDTFTEFCLILARPVSSWTSKASTASSLSSSMSTPPPTISSRPYAWPPTLTTPVYKPTAVTPRKSQFYDWPTPIGSAQTSPALSFVSVTDKEVESVMNNLFSLDEASNLTPSPSPMVEKELTSSLHSDGIKLFDTSCYEETLCKMTVFICSLFGAFNWLLPTWEPISDLEIPFGSMIPWYYMIFTQRGVQLDFSRVMVLGIGLVRRGVNSLIFPQTLGIGFLLFYVLGGLTTKLCTFIKSFAIERLKP